MLEKEYDAVVSVSEGGLFIGVYPNTVEFDPPNLQFTILTNEI